jgi:hypothetical protein
LLAATRRHLARVYSSAVSVTADPAILPLLACPQCLAGSLRSAGDAVAACECVACGTRFPSVGGLPWLIAEPQARLADWRQRHHLMVRELEHEAQLVEDSLARARADASATRRRLQQRARALLEQRDCLRSLLAPLELDTPVARYETHLALRTRLPTSQDLHAYYANVHRDWAWGEEEIRAEVALARELLGTHRPRALAVAGSGACRMVHDLHLELDLPLTVAFDINPLLMLCAARLLQGGEVVLHEFPIAPRSADDAACRRTLRGPATAPPGLHLLFGDVARAPLQSGAFDTLLTPWLIDILPQPFEVLAARVNALLPAGGVWVNLGSLAFQDADPLLRLDPAEVVEVLQRQGFEVVLTREAEVPYMRSPLSRHSRRELLFGFRAVRRRAVEADADTALPLPEWLVDARVAVPALPHFRTQALATRVYAFVTALIDGRRGMGEIAAHLVEQRLMRAEEAVPAVRAFLLQLYEESRRSSATRN